MTEQTSGLWWLVFVVTGAVGAAMMIYGIRQREPLPLVFGIALGVVPMCVSSGWVAALLAAGIGVLFVVIRKYS